MKLTQDKQLLKQLKNGNGSAVRRWYAEFYPRLFQLLMNKVSNEKDAEELAQDTFLSCLKHLPLFRGESGIWTWMVRIAHHEVADYYRKRYAKKFIRALPLSEFFACQGVDDAHVVSMKVVAVFKLMSEESRELLQLKYVDRKKVREIASELGKSAKAVESLLFRARAEFRDLYATEVAEVGVAREK